MVEMGRVGICCEISMMSQQLYHVFAYLKVYHNARIVFDLSYPDVNFDDFKRKDWEKMYGDAREEIPPNCLECLERSSL